VTQLSKKEFRRLCSLTACLPSVGPTKIRVIPGFFSLEQREESPDLQRGSNPGKVLSRAARRKESLKDEIAGEKRKSRTRCSPSV
jgi:hypothetical protein